MRTLFRHPLRVWHVVAVFFGLFIAPALHLPGADHHPDPSDSASPSSVSAGRG